MTEILLQDTFEYKIINKINIIKIFLSLHQLIYKDFEFFELYIFA